MMFAMFNLPLWKQKEAVNLSQNEGSTIKNVQVWELKYPISLRGRALEESWNLEHMSNVGGGLGSVRHPGA